MTQRRSAYALLRALALPFALGFFVLHGAAIVQTFALHWAQLLVLLAFFSALLAVGVPALTFPQFGRRESPEVQITLDLPVFALSLAIFGPVVTALLSFIANTIAVGTGRQYNARERLLIAATRVVFWVIVAVVMDALHVPLTRGDATGFGIYFAFNFAWSFLFIILWFDPLTSVRTGRPLLLLWARHLPDLTLWALFGAQMIWGYLATIVYVRAGALYGLVLFVPIVLLAKALRALHQERLSAHRMSLARDAVWNMLQARDPAAQINSMLSSVHSDAPQETLQIYAGMRSEERPSPLASVGPWPHDDRTPLVRRALLELHAYNKDMVTVRDDESAVTAYGIRAGRLLGSLVVHRPHSAPVRVQPKRYAAVAEELAPLLRDVRSVVAARDAASIDSLTGLLNRQSILRVLREQLMHVTPSSGCGVLLLDVDHFKSVNDQLGHLAGDECLRVMAQTIAANIRPGDRAGRLGGEEFVVVMNVAAASAAAAAGERLRTAIEQSGARHADGSPVTASIGVAVASVADTPESLIDRADRALYQAKHSGRNRVIEISA